MEILCKNIQVNAGVPQSSILGLGQVAYYTFLISLLLILSIILLSVLMVLQPTASVNSYLNFGNN